MWRRYTEDVCYFTTLSAEFPLIPTFLSKVSKKHVFCPDAMCSAAKGKQRLLTKVHTVGRTRSIQFLFLLLSVLVSGWGQFQMKPVTWENWLELREICLQQLDWIERAEERWLTHYGKIVTWVTKLFIQWWCLSVGTSRLTVICSG